VKSLADTLAGPTISPANQFALHAITSPESATATVLLIGNQRHLDRGPLLADTTTKHAAENYLSLNIMLAHSFSRGSVHIRSSRLAEKPIVDFAYLTHPLDIEILARHILLLERLLACEPLAFCVKKNGKRLPASFPRIATVEGAKEMVRACAHTNYHPVGTCAMMSESVGGVVDPTLRVYGTTIVRVCDASVIPVMPRGNILTTVYAVAERAADIVKGTIEEQRK
jgi:choline dehydrogenase-like flavoprotein